jgi:hypothetical protein
VKEFGRLLGAEGRIGALEYLSRKGESFLAIHTAVIAVQDQILQEYGAGDALDQVTAIARRVKKFCTWIQDLECIALVAPDDVHSEFTRGRLAYQVELSAQ